jgi:hypothetical protein
MFDPYGDQRDTEKKPRPWWVTCLFGCLIFAVIAMVLFIIVLYWISQNWRGWASEGGAFVVMQMVNESDLPPEEKQQIQVQVDRVADAVRSKDLSLPQMGEIFEKLVDSPLLTTIIVSTVDTKYIEPSGLGDEEKAAAMVTLDRFVRGVVDGAIDEQSTEAALKHVADKQPDGNWQMRNTVTDVQLEAFLAEAKQQADEAEIPQDPPAFDPSDEVKRVIDDVMGGHAAPAEIDTPVEIEQPVEVDEPPEADDSGVTDEPITQQQAKMERPAEAVMQ